MEKRLEGRLIGRKSRNSLYHGDRGTSAVLPEAPQTSGRPAVIDMTNESAYRSLRKKGQVRRDTYKPMLIVEMDLEVLEAERPGRRPKRRAKLPKRFEDCQLE